MNKKGFFLSAAAMATTAATLVAIAIFTFGLGTTWTIVQNGKTIAIIIALIIGGFIIFRIFRK